MVVGLRLDAILSGVDAALEWWNYRLAEVLPQGLRAALRPKPPRCALIADEEGVIYAQLRNGRYLAQTQEPWIWDKENRLRLPKSIVKRLKSREQVALRIASSLLLTRPLSFPLSVEAHLSQALALQLDRHLPLKPELLYFDYALLARDVKRGSIEIELAAIRRAHVDALVQACILENVRPVRAQIDTSDRKATSPLNFLRERLALERRLARRVNFVLICGFFLTLWGTQTVLEYTRGRELAALKDAIAQLAPQEEQGRALSRQISGLREEAEVTQLGREGPSVSGVLSDLSKRIPPAAWLSSFEYSRTKREILMSGFADDATIMVSALSKSPLVSEPGLRGAVTRDPKGHERFDLIARLPSDPGT